MPKQQFELARDRQTKRGRDKYKDRERHTMTGEKEVEKKVSLMEAPQ